MDIIIASALPELLEEEDLELFESAKRLREEEFDLPQNKRLKMGMPNQMKQRRRAGKTGHGKYGYKTYSNNTRKRLAALERKVTVISPSVKIHKGRWNYTDWLGLGVDFRDHSIFQAMKSHIDFDNQADEVRIHSVHVRIPLTAHLSHPDASNRFRLVIWSYKNLKPTGTLEKGNHPFTGVDSNTKHSAFLDTKLFNIWYDKPVTSYDQAILEANIVFRYPLKMTIGNNSTSAEPLYNDVYVTWVDEDKKVTAFDIMHKVRFTQNNS